MQIRQLQTRGKKPRRKCGTWEKVLPISEIKPHALEDSKPCKGDRIPFWVGLEKCMD